MTLIAASRRPARHKKGSRGVPRAFEVEEKARYPQSNTNRGQRVRLGLPLVGREILPSLVGSSPTIRSPGILLAYDESIHTAAIRFQWRESMIDAVFNVAVFAALVLCIVGFGAWAHKRVP